MTAVLPRECKERLAKLIPRLSDENEAEVVNAARLICSTLKTAGLTVHDFAESLVVPVGGFTHKNIRRAPPPEKEWGPPRRPDDVSDHLFVIEAARFILDAEITVFEKDFVENMRRGARNRGDGFRMAPAQLRNWEKLLERAGI